MNASASHVLLEAAAVSLRTAGLATILALVVGGLLAWLTSGRRSWWTVLLEFSLSLPLVLPPAMLGFYLLRCLGPESPVGRLLHWLLDMEIVFTPAAAAIAAAATAVPIAYRAITLLLDQVNPDLIAAAELDGASAWQVLLFVRLPLAWSGILAGVMLSFLRALGEFGATLMVAGNIPGRTQTLSLALWASVLGGQESTAHVAAVLLAGLSAGILLVVRLLGAASGFAPRPS